VKGLFLSFIIHYFLLFANLGFSFEIRIGIETSDPLQISGDGYFEIYGPDGFIGRRFNSGINLVSHNNGIIVGGYGVFSPPIFIIGVGESYPKLSKRRYRGTIEINKKQEILQAINTVDIEEYLYGVIKMEINTKWPMETLKAQAVLARTFAYQSLGKYNKRGYDLCDEVCCQVYRGINAEDERAIFAVNKTTGEVLYYNKSLANIYYHSTCGGKTTNPKSVWGGRENLFSSVVCPYCSGSPNYSWKLYLSFDDISSKLNIGNVSSINCIYTSDGRVAKIIINGKRIFGNEFRKLFGTTKVKSTLFRIEEKKNGIMLIGKGYGHGVGLCQWGAKKMGDFGFTYKDILSFYFPGCEVKRILED